MNPSSLVELPVKPVAATVDAVFDFLGQIPQGDTLASAACTISVWTGTDPSPGSILSGSATVAGTQATQRLTGGLSGVIYLLACIATLTSGLQIPQQGLLVVMDGLI